MTRLQIMQRIENEDRLERIEGIERMSLNLCLMEL